VGACVSGLVTGPGPRTRGVRGRWHGPRRSTTRSPRLPPRRRAPPLSRRRCGCAQEPERLGGHTRGILAHERSGQIDAAEEGPLPDRYVTSITASEDGNRSLVLERSLVRRRVDAARGPASRPTNPLARVRRRCPSRCPLRSASSCAHRPSRRQDRPRGDRHRARTASRAGPSARRAAADTPARRTHGAGTARLERRETSSGSSRLANARSLSLPAAPLRIAARHADAVGPLTDSARSRRAVRPRSDDKTSSARRSAAVAAKLSG
jgi:hypothetical protein